MALALPAHDAEHVRAVADGFVSGAYSFKRYKSKSDEAGLADVSILSDAARRQDAIAALETARTVGHLVNRARDWVNTPPNDLTPELFADAVVALGKELTGRSKEPKVDIEVVGPGSWRARVRRHPRGRTRLGQRPSAGEADVGAR